jgi:hypothetical protein
MGNRFYSQDLATALNVSAAFATDAARWDYSKITQNYVCLQQLGERYSFNAGLDLAFSVISSGSIFFLTSSVAERLQACDFVKTCCVES